MSNWVVKEMFFDVIFKYCYWFLDIVYDFLVFYGYVNFGVVFLIKERIFGEFSKGSVIIIGAGLVGLVVVR